MHLNTHTKRVAKRVRSAYTAPVAETAATRCESRKCSVADNRRSAVFLRPYTLCLLQWSGLGGGALAHAGSHGRRSLNPALCPAAPFESGRRVIQSVRGGRIMRQATHARSGQSPLILSIVREALRAAATADTYQDALDATGDALRRVAELAQSEVRHG